MQKPLEKGLRWLEVVAVVLCVVLNPVQSLAENTFPSSGNVGIGTVTPAKALHVRSSDPHARVEDIDGHTADFGVSSIAPNWGAGIWVGDVQQVHFYGRGLSLGRFVNSDPPTGGLISSGAIGVGTMAPQGLLQLGEIYSGNGEPTNHGQLVLHSTVGSVETLSGVEFKDFPGYGNKIYVNAGFDYLAIASRFNSTAWTEHVVIKQQTGNVGIGTIAPSARLHVAGDVQVDGNIAAKYQDVAEWVKATGELSHGTVVIIAPHELNRVATANQAYDTRVAGVVSTKPGMLLGEGGEGKSKVAHSGRVKVKVDASYGPIAVGDLLVTSPTPGHAMRSEPVNVSGIAMHRPGTLVGKALESLGAGQGEILVLLTLQ